MGITITDVKVVGACRKHDTNKEYLKTPEEDIYCIECSFKPEVKPELFVKGKPILDYAEFLLSLGKEKDIIYSYEGQEGKGMSATSFIMYDEAMPSFTKEKPAFMGWLEEEYKELSKNPSYKNAERLDVIITIMNKINRGDFRGLM